MNEFSPNFKGRVHDVHPSLTPKAQGPGSSKMHPINTSSSISPSLKSIFNPNPTMTHSSSSSSPLFLFLCNNMNSLSSSSSSSPSASLSSITLLLQHPLRSRLSYHHRRSLLHPNRNLNQRKKRSLRCRADLSQDAPFALAIGSCVLNSLIFPVTSDGDDGDADGGSGINSTDTRFAVMGIISFIPYFNWLSWIFAWLDTGRQRYLVYSIVYLAPYLRTNLSLSPEESWLPLSSIIFCIAHIQLEASIRSGDIKTNELFGEALKFLSPVKREKDAHMQSHQGFEMDEEKKERMKLHSAQEESRNKIQGLGVPRKPLDDDAQRQTDDQENDYERKD